MKGFLKFSLSAFLLSVSAMLPLYSLDIEGSLDLVGGYRTDQISTMLKAYDSAGTFLLSDNLKARNITIGEIGAEGRLVTCNGVLVRGFANYGWVTDGSYTDVGIDAIGNSSTTKAKVYNGHVTDYSIGLGYLFAFEHYYTIGPVIGWAYDSQEIKIRHAQTDRIHDLLLDGVAYKMRWQGPWIGFEGAFELGSIKLRTGYDFHFVEWRADWLLDGPDVVGGHYSDKRKSNQGYGNVAFFDGYYTFCEGWEIGLGVKYQYWLARDGREVPRNGDFASVGLEPDEKHKIPSVHWKSCELRLMLGYSF